MKGGIGAVKSIHFETRDFPLSREQQLKRLRRVIREELTPIQKEIVLAYYFQKQTMVAIARERGVNKSTVCRTLHRAEDKLRRFMK